MDNAVAERKTRALPEEVQQEIGALPVQADRSRDIGGQFSEHLKVRWWLAQVLAESGMVPDRKPEAVLAKMAYGFELGIPLMQAQNGLAYIKGKVAMEAKLMDALATKNCGVKKTVLHSGTDECRMILHREGWEDMEVSFTSEEARTAGLIKDHMSEDAAWKKYPSDMLYWRALSRGLRRIAPDYFTGVYLQDELAPEVAVLADMAGGTATNAELDALENGVDPQINGHVLELDEIEELGKVLDAAVRRELIDQAERKRIMDRAVKGEEGVRGELRVIEDQLNATSFLPTPQEADRLRQLVDGCREEETLRENEADEAEFMIDMGNGEGVRSMIEELEKRTAA